MEGSSIVFPGKDVVGSGLCGVFEDLMHHLRERQLVLVLLGALGAFCSEFSPARCYHAW